MTRFALAALTAGFLLAGCGGGSDSEALQGDIASPAIQESAPTVEPESPGRRSPVEIAEPAAPAEPADPTEESSAADEAVNPALVVLSSDGPGTSNDLAVAVRNAGNGDIIQLEPGRYEVNVSIEVLDDITIIGSGAGETIIVGDTDPVIDVRGSTVTILNLSIVSTVEVAEEAYTALQVVDGADVTLDGIAITDSLGGGLGIFESSARVSNSEFARNLYGFVSVGASSVQMANNVATDNRTNGFVWSGAATGTATANLATGNGELGFYIVGASDVELLSNTATENAIAGFAVDGQATALLRGNISMQNEVGFGWGEDSGGQAIGNTASQNSLSGFIVRDQATPTLQSNTSFDNDENGFAWFHTSAGEATGNVAYRNAFFGFSIDDDAAPALQAYSSRENTRGEVFGNATPDNEGLIRVAADTASAQSDFASAVSLAQDGDVIVLEPGTHTVDTAVRLRNSVTIIGGGRDETTIVSPELPAIALEDADVGIFHLTVRSTLVPTNDNLRFATISVEDSSDAFFDNVAVAQSPGDGIAVFDSNLVLSHALLTDSHWSGLALVGQSAATVAATVAQGNGAHGFRWFDTSTGTAIGNTAESNDGGFAVFNTSDVELIANTASSSRAAGFWITGRATPVLIGNTATGNGGFGFSAIDDVEPTLIANTSLENVVGFVWEDQSSGVASFNTATRNQIDGFNAQDETSPELTGNVAAENVRGPFEAWASASPTLSNNNFGDS